MSSTTSVTLDRRTIGLSAAALATSVLLGFGLVKGLDAATLALITTWNGPMWFSLRISAAAIVLAALVGCGIGYWLAKSTRRGLDTIEALLSVPMILPPTVVGYYLVTTFTTATHVGKAAESLLGRPLIGSIYGCVLAAAISAFPFCMRATRTAVAAVDPRAEQMARALGLPEWRVALQVTIPLAWRGTLVGLTIGYLRALGEYGATAMVGGIPTMSIAVIGAATWAESLAIIKVLLVLAALALAALAYLRRSPE